MGHSVPLKQETYYQLLLTSWLRALFIFINKTVFISKGITTIKMYYKIVLSQVFCFSDVE